MIVAVQRDDVKYFCKTEEQLKNFLAAGYVEITESDGVGVDNTSTPKKKIGRPKKNTI